jgi:CHAT domain-containing protein
MTHQRRTSLLTKDEQSTSSIGSTLTWSLISSGACIRASLKILRLPLFGPQVSPAAPKGAVKTVPLQNFRIVYFATHALLPEENTLAKPAIVLTPPATATAEGDGLLTADEIAGLRLNADWVVLSACNTVGPLGRGLSGLARAFLFAGAKALLVSHWYVASDATSGLISSMFEIYARDPAMGRSEALRAQGP